ncbi:MAG: DNA primase [Anaerolineaceae bacterium]|nr:DNA primase [Anaerolineaceae bacterium]
MTAIDEIKSRLDIVELVGENVKLRRAGKNYTGFCPFHANTRTPAFVVFPDSGTWRCFGQCNEGGDIFGYVMKKEGWDFSQTLQYLAQRAGVELEPLTPEKKAEDEQYERLYALLEEAVNFYRHHLLQTPAGKPALVYLQQRGLLPQTIETFGLGYAPGSWDSALTYFTGKGYTQQEMLDAGLTTERQGSEGAYDRFRNRILFPIRDTNGRMAGFGARILNPEDVPKFLNSPQTAVFDKGRLLYGLDLARKTIRSQDQAVIVEGYLDVILLHQSGFSNAVSPMGTALTEHQLRMLKRYTRRIIMALDADAAGEKATLRGLEVARQALDHSTELVFDARGLLRYEARLQADLRVTTMPEGMDPDEVVLRDPQEWAEIIAGAQPVVIHVMDTLMAGRNLDDPKIKSEIAAQVTPLIEDVPDAVERDTYRQRLARLLRVDESALLGARSSGGRPARRRSRQEEQAQGITAPPAASTKAELSTSLERHILRLLLHQPEALYTLDRALQHAGLSRFSPEDFEQGDYQLFTRLLKRSLEQDEDEPAAYLMTSLPELLQETAKEMLLPLEKGEPTPERLVEELVRAVMRLRQVRINSSLGQLRYMQEDLQAQGETMMESFQEMVLGYTQTLARLNRALGKPLQLD